MKRISVTFITLLLVMACSSDKPVGQTEAEILYKEAVELVESERFLLATERLNIIKSQYPYSFFATPAELLQAEIYFKQENYIESAAAFLVFRDLHPRHERLNYVLWMIAESFYRQLPSTYDRDLSPGLDAIKYYSLMIERFPSDPRAEVAKTRLNEINEMLKNRERYVADFYFRTEEFDAARFRYLSIIEKYSDEELLNHSKTRLILSSFHGGAYDLCLSYHQRYFDSLDESSKKRVASIASDCQENLIEEERSF